MQTKPKQNYSVILFIWKKKYNPLFTKTFSTSTLTRNTNDTHTKKIKKSLHEKTLIKWNIKWAFIKHNNSITFTHRQIWKDHVTLTSSQMGWRGGWGSRLYLSCTYTRQFVLHSDPKQSYMNWCCITKIAYQHRASQPATSSRWNFRESI